MVVLRISFLGGARVEAGSDTAILSPGPKATGLLAYLATAPNLRARRSDIANFLWSEARTTSAARHALRQCLVRLRSQLGPCGFVLQADDTYVWLVEEQVSTDIDEVTAALEHGTEAAVVAVSGAIRGEFCAGLETGSEEFELWLRAQRGDYDRMCARLHDRATEILAGLGQADDAIAAARRRLDLEPLDDAAHAALIALCVHFGRRQDAVTAHRDCRQLFRTELGIEPGAEVDEALSPSPGQRRPAPLVIRPHNPPIILPFMSLGGLAVLSSLTFAVFQAFDAGPDVGPDVIESRAMPVWVSPASTSARKLTQSAAGQGDDSDDTRSIFQQADPSASNFGMLYPVGC